MQHMIRRMVAMLTPDPISASSSSSMLLSTIHHIKYIPVCNPSYVCFLHIIMIMVLIDAMPTYVIVAFVTMYIASSIVGIIDYTINLGIPFTHTLFMVYSFPSYVV
jgi:hypothetical protein